MLGVHVAGFQRIGVETVVALEQLGDALVVVVARGFGLVNLLVQPELLAGKLAVAGKQLVPFLSRAAGLDQAHGRHRARIHQGVDRSIFQQLDGDD